MSAVLDSPWRRLRYTRLRDLLRGRVDGSLDWRRVIATSDLPPELAEIVFQCVRRTRLWRRERVAVATELAAHFRDGLDAGQTSAELAASFGDTAAAAKLIRRAKKRGRSLWWHAWRWCFWGVAALVATYVFLWARMWWGRPEVRVDYLDELNRRAAAVDPDKAAWPVYERAMRELGYQNGKLPAGVDWSHLPQDAATDANFAAFEARHREAIAKLREAAGRTGLGGVVDAEGDFRTELLVSRVRLRYVPLTQAAVQVLLAQARFAAAQGDVATAVADAIAVLNLSRQIQEQPFLVSGYHAMACTKAAYKLIEELVRDHRDVMTDEQLRDVAHAVASVQLDLSWWLTGERLSSRDLMQHLFTDDGAGGGHMTAQGIETLRSVVEPLVMVVDGKEYTSVPLPPNPSWWRRFAASFNAKALVAPVAMASRREMTEMFERHFDEVSASSDQPLWEWESPEVEDVVSGWSERERLRFYPLTLLFPASGVARRQVEWNRGAQDGVLVGLALELYRREQGAWPEKLEELSPRYLPSVPVDRMSGKPLGYVVRDDRPVVYSVGSDLDDDGGRAVAGERGEWIASPGGYWGSRKFDTDKDGDWVLWGGGVREGED